MYVENVYTYVHVMLFCWKIGFVVIYAVLSRNLFCRDLGTFVWRKIEPKIAYVEKKWQIWGMQLPLKTTQDSWAGNMFCGSLTIGINYFSLMRFGKISPLESISSAVLQNKCKSKSTLCCKDVLCAPSQYWSIKVWHQKVSHQIWMQADVTVDNCAFCVFYPAHAMVMLTLTMILLSLFS